MKYIRELIEVLFRKRGKSIRHRILAAMMAIVVFCTTYTLILPAITLDSQTAETEPGIEAETAVEETLDEVQEADLLLSGQNADEGETPAAEPETKEIGSEPTETEEFAATPETEEMDSVPKTEAMESVEETETEELTETETEETETEETEPEEIPETESEKPEQPEGWNLGKVLEALGSAPEQLMDSVSSIKDQFGFGRK